MSPEATVWLILTALLMLAAYLHLAHRRRKAARAAVNAECLVCPYLEAFEDVTAARKAGNEHGAATGHPLMLVLAGNGPA